MRTKEYQDSFKLQAPSVNLWCCRLAKLPHISIIRLGIYFDEVLNAFGGQKFVSWLGKSEPPSHHLLSPYSAQLLINR